MNKQNKQKILIIKPIMTSSHFHIPSTEILADNYEIDWFMLKSKNRVLSKKCKIKFLDYGGEEKINPRRGYLNPGSFDTMKIRINPR